MQMVPREHCGLNFTAESFRYEFPFDTPFFSNELGNPARSRVRNTTDFKPHKT